MKLNAHVTRRLLLVVSALSLLAVGAAPRAAVPLPARLTDQELWALSSGSSEPNGFFRSDNLTSNELWFQHVIPELLDRTRPGGVYLGVGPEQNFTYMVATRPAMAVIFDIRRGNMLVQFMYKAIFELSADRADFVSMLFSKPRPKGLDTSVTAAQLFAAFEDVPGDEALLAKNLTAIDARLTRTHRFPLTDNDLRGISSVLRTFYASGFAVRPSPTYADLMTADDGAGEVRSYLASEEAFLFLKQLEAKNMVVPVVGDFAGPKALRAIGAYLKQHGARVSAFYLSNVEQYLYQDRTWSVFCRNVATLPLDAGSTFIRSASGGGYGRGPFPRFVSSLGRMAEEVTRCDAN